VTAKPDVRRILVINLHSSYNAGDSALLQATVAQLRDAFPLAQLTLAVNDVESVTSQVVDGAVIPSFMALFGPVGKEQGQHWRLLRMLVVFAISFVAGIWYRWTHRVVAQLPSRLGALVQSYCEAEIVVGCPGNIFFTLGRFGIPFLVSGFTVGFALLLKKPLYVMPQSIGPLHRRWERHVVRALYSRARLLFVREPVSARLMRELGMPDERVHLVPDLAVNLLAAPIDQLPGLLHGASSRHHPRLGITVINQIVRAVDDAQWTRYVLSVAYAATMFLETYGGEVYFCPQVIGPTLGEDDRVMARRVLAQMPLDSNVQLVEMQTDASLLKAAYGQMDLFIATRMHSGIFAVTMGVPTLFIGYLHKTRGLVEMLDMEEWLLDIAKVTEGSLWDKLEALWLEREQVRSKLSSVVPILQCQAAQAAARIAENFHTYG